MNVDGDVDLGLIVPALDLALGPHTGGLGGGLLSVYGGLDLGRLGVRLGLALRLCFEVGLASLDSSEGEAMAFWRSLSGIFLQAQAHFSLNFMSLRPPVHENIA